MALGLLQEDSCVHQVHCVLSYQVEAYTSYTLHRVEVYTSYTLHKVEAYKNYNILVNYVTCISWLVICHLL